MTNLYKSLENKLFPFVEKPGRYIGGELNGIVKTDAELNGVLCFPDLYDIGMSHYGSQILYNIVNSNEKWSFERAYMPWFDAEEIMRKNDIPLYSLERFLPLQVFDFLAFTVQYELQYTNILSMLSLANIPIWTKDRNDGDPIVIGGGIVLANSEPVADFFDVIFAGDGEKVIIEFCEIMQNCKEKKLSRKDTLQEISKIESAYIPQNYQTKKTKKYTAAIFDKSVQFGKIQELNDNYIPQKQIAPIVETVHNRMTAEIMRGCTRGCRFCAAGYYYRPVRERDSREIISQIKNAVFCTGWDEIGLLSLSTADYSQFFPLLCELKNNFSEIKIGIPSTRIDAMDEKTQDLLNEISQASSLTIAPEAGSQRLRNVINKDFSQEKILEAVEILAKRNKNTIKLYFMLGLPSETDEDIDEMIFLIKKCAEIVYSHTKRCLINVSLSPFSPKPHTPFQWEKLCDLKVISQRCVRVKNAFLKIKNVNIDYRDTSLFFCESALARGDRELSKFIYELFLNGAKFEGWNDNLSVDLWKKCAEKCQINLEKYTREIDLDEELPWDIISTGVSKNFLLEERQKAFSQTKTKDCRETCNFCGVCDKELKIRLASVSAISTIKIREFEKEDKYKENKEVIRTKIRISYKKIERARFMSHRNLMDCVSKALVASKTPLAFSQGFRSRPKISFAQPLPLGAIGENELCDVIILGENTVNIEKINSLLPLGIEFLSQKIICLKTPSIEQSVIKTNWRIEKINPDLDMEIAVKKFIFQDVIEIKTRKKEQDIFLKIFPSEIQNLSANEFEIRFCVLAEQKYRPSDIVKAAFPDNLISDFRIVRESFIINE